MYLFNQKKNANHIVWKIFGGAAAGLVIYGLISNFADIKRYIKISTM